MPELCASSEFTVNAPDDTDDDNIDDDEDGVDVVSGATADVIVDKLFDCVAVFVNELFV